MQMNRTILIIDDDIDFQFMIGNILEKCGYMVKSLLEGKIAVAMDVAKTCDLVLLDIELPGSNGIEIGQMLKSQHETVHIPVIVLSGHSEVDKMFAACQANAFIQKPFSLSCLVTKIDNLLAETVIDDPHDQPSADRATAPLIT
jgi:DNA-binding response OmpR family regulator